MRAIAGMVAISLLVANSAFPSGTTRAAESAGRQTAEQASRSLLRHRGPRQPHPSLVGVEYYTYETTCATSPECVEIAASLTRASGALALEEIRAESARRTVEMLEGDIRDLTEELEKRLGTLTQAQIDGSRKDLNGLQTQMKEAAERYDLASKWVALLRNRMDNLALDLEACEARCPPKQPALANYFNDDPHEGPMVAPPYGGPPYRQYVTSCPSRPECVDIAAQLSKVSLELSEMEQDRSEANSGIILLRNTINSVMTKLYEGTAGYTPEEVGSSMANAWQRVGELERERDDIDSRVPGVTKRFQELMEALNACEAGCPRATTSNDQTPRVSTAKIGVGAAAIGTGIAVIVTRGGGSDPGPPPATPTTPTTPTPPTTPTAPPPPTPPTSPAFDPSGNYQAVIPFSGGNPDHVRFVNLGSSGLLTLTRNSPVRITSPNVMNWVPVSGEYDDAANRFNLTGNGTVAGLANVSVRFEGSVTTAGQITGRYTMGAAGELPGGQPVVYAVTGQKQ